MTGRKDRAFASRVEVSLEDLVPADHFYWQMERALDPTFVRNPISWLGSQVYSFTESDSQA